MAEELDIQDIAPGHEGRKSPPPTQPLIPNDELVVEENPNNPPLNEEVKKDLEQPPPPPLDVKENDQKLKEEVDEKAGSSPKPLPEPYNLKLGTLGGTASSCLTMEEKTLTWHISRFPDVMKIFPKSEKNQVELHFCMGDTISLSSNWKIHMHMKGDDIGVFLYLLNAPPSWDKPVFAGLRFSLLENDGMTPCKSHELAVRDFSQVKQYGWQGFTTMTQISTPGNRILTKEDKRASFMIKISLLNPTNGLITEGKATDKVVTIDPPPMGNNVEGQPAADPVFVEAGRKSMAQDLGNLLSSGNHADVALTAGDGTIFKAHRAILSARSPVFYAMFESQMSEGQTGQVDIDDMSGPALELLLKFIYTSEFTTRGKGCLWQEVCDQLINAAAKYSLPILKDQCDHHLVTACTTNNALPLLRLARLHGLTTAEVKVKEWIKENVDGILNGGL